MTILRIEHPVRDYDRLLTHRISSANTSANTAAEGQGRSS